MKKKLISIITPSYNSEKYIDNYFNSIMKQTYDNLEIIYVNDGSTDKTDEKIEKYKKELKNTNIKLIYIKKKNGGVSSAINEGLKIFHGDYVVFHDADDTYEPTAFEKMLNVLEENNNYGFVRVNAKCISEEGKVLNYFYKAGMKMNENILEDIVIKHSVFMPGFMYDAKKLLKEIPNREIYNSPKGQNYQLLVPMAYKYKCGYIDEVLCNYLVRKSSLSHGSESYEKRVQRTSEINNILKIVLKQINVLEKYEQVINEYEIRTNYRSSLIYNKKKEIEKYYREMKKGNYYFNKLDKIMYLLYKLHLLIFLLKIYEKITKKVLA